MLPAGILLLPTVKVVEMPLSSVTIFVVNPRIEEKLPLTDSALHSRIRSSVMGLGIKLSFQDSISNRCPFSS